jgi:hypothetical protein
MSAMTLLTPETAGSDPTCRTRRPSGCRTE